MTWRSEALATVLWALAFVDYDPGEDFLRSVVEQALPQLESFKATDAVNSLWACARFGYRPSSEFLEAVQSCDLQRLEATDLSNLLWSFGRRFGSGDDSDDAFACHVKPSAKSLLLHLGDVCSRKAPAAFTSLSRLDVTPDSEFLNADTWPTTHWMG